MYDKKPDFKADRECLEARLDRMGNAGKPVTVFSLVALQQRTNERAGVAEFINFLIAACSGKNSLTRQEIADAFDSYVAENPLPGETGFDGSGL